MPAPIKDKCVDLGRRHIHVTQQLLDRADVVTALQKMGRKRIPQRVRGGGFDYPCRTSCALQ